MNKDVEDFHRSFWSQPEEEDIEELFESIKYETDKSYLFGDKGTKDNDCWLPKSQVEVTEISNGYKVRIPEWLAKKKDLI
jgi:hypothetical protein